MFGRKQQRVPENAERDELLADRDRLIDRLAEAAGFMGAILPEVKALEDQVDVYRQAIERADSELALTELPCECDEGAECYCLTYDSRGQITKARQFLAAVVVGQPPDKTGAGGDETSPVVEVSEGG